jgi:hypothetical protein
MVFEDFKSHPFDLSLVATFEKSSNMPEKRTFPWPNGIAG